MWEEGEAAPLGPTVRTSDWSGADTPQGGPAHGPVSTLTVSYGLRSVVGSVSVRERES